MPSQEEAEVSVSGRASFKSRESNLRSERRAGNGNLFVVFFAWLFYLNSGFDLETVNHCTEAITERMENCADVFG